jgi:excisionase family DNA binding protein
MSKTASLVRLLSLREVADTLGVSIRTLHRFIASGDLVIHRIGHQLRVTQNDLEFFLKVRRQT